MTTLKLQHEQTAEILKIQCRNCRIYLEPDAIFEGKGGSDQTGGGHVANCYNRTLDHSKEELEEESIDRSLVNLDVL
jgi:hypothetical protein